MTDSSLPTRYDPKQVEEKWYRAWDQAGAFRPEFRTGGDPYCIAIPPPNVTGSLHMGHALCYSIQDVLGRWKRMSGCRVLVLPGTDHAGIATQKVVESQLKEEGVSRHDLGRDAFERRVWEWKAESGGTILKQFKRLGFAFDWSRERFTMDPKYHAAVIQVFLEWFERGLIYRGKRIVNWDPGLQTSVSDIEVDEEVRRGKLYHFRYPFADGGGHVVIATTRPETMLADVAVAVHPGDKRYSHLVGKSVALPLVGRVIPLVADEYPDPEFGSGAVKITPAHDANDYEVGIRLGLDMNEVPVCIDGRAKVIAEGTPYHGLDRYEARKRIVADLDALGLVEKIEDYDIPLKVSQRSGQVIEPLLSEQWFCRMKDLAAPAIDAVRTGKIKFTPERYTDVYLNWMENIRDWCVSRQLWWGHRIPVYYAEDGKPIGAKSIEEAREIAGGDVTPDEDVLDTWFSSALWPFATLGWPDESQDRATFYPTNVLVTARDIIYLWVARMIMDGLDQVNEIPFHDVYVYATVLTEDGKRMSKSLGTGVDPIEYIDRFGADAMRFSLLIQTGHNQEIRFGEKRIEEARNFCNKIWNASRFVLMNCDGFGGSLEPPSEGLEIEDRWILSRLSASASKVQVSLENYNMMEACRALHEFFWGEYCDWYIEAVKPRLAGDSRSTPQAVLLSCLDGFCRLMHPFMPHITEEIWHRLPGIEAGLFLDYAAPRDLQRWTDDQAEQQMAEVQEIVRVVRNLRAEAGVKPMQRIPAIHLVGFSGDVGLISSQAWFESVQGGVPSGNHVSASCGSVEVHLPLSGLIDAEQEIGRLEREQERLRKEQAGLLARLENPQFIDRAKPEVVARDRAASEEIAAALATIGDRIERIKESV
jgi:valyl-tRNA synthetase